MLVVLRHIQAHQLRTGVDHRLDGGQIPGSYHFNESTNRGPINERFELRPALQPVGASENELRIVQREAGRIGVPVVAVDFPGRVGVPGAERVEQLLGFS
jgi:hypothetical protein